ncbi:hypothetical protein GUITHDRAFT_116169 [Guillardia theta CCMP2712]|uniref:TNFR-Cys domain-containing protein n=1 Tax=Guillardia theta (strain CCMP2712) TaxID=905079 RepID=L1IN53_GUITC|nr:hypothetical protein GUITHDRAFT_116169 [Guillardia theta CCMP2712]EKX37693.1 hypothetical protein GUITHDRAFT_116169 [Guillardia theta CCMP2712]|eukprot:XP_005824673.1 hypothetical protein GUITHDRAFT_116169 [Guillardia theta CCMP2712]
MGQLNSLVSLNIQRTDDGIRRRIVDGQGAGQYAVRLSNISNLRTRRNLTLQCQPCPPGMYKDMHGEYNCTMCATTPCEIGQCRPQCNSTADSVCANCTNKLEGPTVYVSSGYPYDQNDCAWDGNAGLMLSMDSARAISWV